MSPPRMLRRDHHFSLRRRPTK